MPKLAQISPIILPLEVAQTLTAKALRKVEEIGVPYTLTVVDGSGNLVLSTRMDGAALASIETSMPQHLAFVAGAVPIRDSAGVVIGAFGAGGATPDQDHEVAAFAVG